MITRTDVLKAITAAIILQTIFILIAVIAAS